MAIAFVASVSANAVAGNAVTTGSINTSGANLLVGAICSYNGVSAGSVITDSKGNTWIPLTALTIGDTRVQIFYAVNPTVGTGHTFTNTVNVTFSSIEVIAVSGADTTSPFDVQNGATAEDPTTTLQPGSITPTTDGQLLVLGIGARGLSNTSNNVSSVDSSFILQENVSGSAGNSIPGALAYLIQGTAGAINPTVTWTTHDRVAVAIGTFKAAAGTAGIVAKQYIVRVDNSRIW